MGPKMPVLSCSSTTTTMPSTSTANGAGTGSATTLSGYSGDLSAKISSHNTVKHQLNDAIRTSMSATGQNGQNGIDHKLMINAKRSHYPAIEYVEVPSIHQGNQLSVQSGCSKNKYIRLEPTAASSPPPPPPQPSLSQSNALVTTATTTTNNSSSFNGKVMSGGGIGIGNNAIGNTIILNGMRNGIKQQPPKNQLPTPKRILFPRENVQIGWRSTTRKWHVGIGMANMGNTCYLNSTLQALFHVPALANWLMSDDKHRSEYADMNESCCCIICQMANTLKTSQSTNAPHFKPNMIYTKLKVICKHFLMGRQEDAHEFLRYLIDAMEKAYLCRYKNSKEFDQYSKETTPLNQILGGYLKTSVICLSCGHVSETFQHFEDLLLDIRKVGSIQDALKSYFGRERLEDISYKCEACKKKVSATKQFSLERAPAVLCIALKRFSMMGCKLNKHIDFDIKLDMTAFTSNRTAATPSNLTYRLVSIITHIGTSQHCGHYTAIGLSESKSYYQFDDHIVRPITVQSVLNTNAYVMFYELDDTLSNRNSLPFNQIKTNKPLNSTVTTNTCDSSAGNRSNDQSEQFIGPILPDGLKCNKSITVLPTNQIKSISKTNSPFKIVFKADNPSVNGHKNYVINSTVSPTSDLSNGTPHRMNGQRNGIDETSDTVHKILPSMPDLSDPLYISPNRKSNSTANFTTTPPKFTANLNFNKINSPPTPVKHQPSPLKSPTKLNNLTNTILSPNKIGSTVNNRTDSSSLVPYANSSNDSDTDESNSGGNISVNPNSNYDDNTVNRSPQVITTKIGNFNVTPISSTVARDSNIGSTVTNNNFMKRKCNPFNGENGRNGTTDHSVNKRLKNNCSHLGYGNSNVKQWDDQPSKLKDEVLADKREDYNRQIPTELDAEIDLGRQKKMNKHQNRLAGRDNPTYNPFQEQQNQMMTGHRPNNSWVKNRNNHNSYYRHNNRFNNRYNMSSFRNNGSSNRHQPYNRFPQNHKNQFYRRNT